MTQTVAEGSGTGAQTSPALHRALGTPLVPAHIVTGCEPPPLLVAVAEHVPDGGFVGFGVMVLQVPAGKDPVEHPPSPGKLTVMGLASQLVGTELVVTLSGPSHDPDDGEPHVHSQVIGAAVTYVTGVGHEAGHVVPLGAAYGVQPSEASTQTPSSHAPSGGPASPEMIGDASLGLATSPPFPASTSTTASSSGAS